MTSAQTWTEARRELVKIAITRAGKENLLAQQQGPAAVGEMARQYGEGAQRVLGRKDWGALEGAGKSFQSLGAPPQRLGVLGQGAEGVASLMLGKHPELPGNVHMRKEYDPFSPITRGAHTTELLQQKYETNKALEQAAADLGGKVHIPAMARPEVLHTNLAPGLQRHVTHSEFIPGLTHPFDMAQPAPVLKRLTSRKVTDQVRQGIAERSPSALLGAAKEVLQGPMRDPHLEAVHDVLQLAAKRTGVPIHDVVIQRGPLGLSHLINPGNVGVTLQGKPTIIDTLPQTKGMGAGAQQNVLKQLRDFARTTGRSATPNPAVGTSSDPLSIIQEVNHPAAVVPPVAPTLSPNTFAKNVAEAQMNLLRKKALPLLKKRVGEQLGLVLPGIRDNARRLAGKLNLL